MDVLKPSQEFTFAKVPDKTNNAQDNRSIFRIQQTEKIVFVFS